MHAVPAQPTCEVSQDFSFSPEDQLFIKSLQDWKCLVSDNINDDLQASFSTTVLSGRVHHVPQGA